MLITETGAGLPDAESLCSVDFADTYLAGLGMTLWATMSTAEKEQALRRATLYMQQAYRLAWAGSRFSDTQALDWPRVNVPRLDGPGSWGYGPSYLAHDVVPREVQQACAKMAYKAAAGDLAPDLEQTKVKEKIGPIEVEYAPGSSAVVRYREIDNLLAPLLGSRGSNSARVVRA